MPKGTRIANPTGVSIESSKGKGLGTKLKKKTEKETSGNATFPFS